MSCPETGLTVDLGNFSNSRINFPLDLFAKDFPVIAHSPWKAHPWPDCGVSRMELSPSLESQMSWEKKRAIVSSTPWCYLVSVHFCLFIFHAFTFFFWRSFSCFHFLYLRLLGIIPALNRLPFDVFPNKASFVSTVKYLHLTLLFGQIWRGCLNFF